MTRPSTPSPGSPGKAVHTWSLFRTMGRYVAADSMPLVQMPGAELPGLDLLELPAALAEHGYASAQLCHFYLPRRDPSYLAEVAAAFTDSGVALECFLVDDGDLTHQHRSGEQIEWVSSWVENGADLGAERVRVLAGQQAPTPELLAASAARMVELAERHDRVRIVFENFHALTPDATAVNTLLDLAEGKVGFLIDLANWGGADKYDQLRAVAARAETCQAKVNTDASGRIDADDYRASLGVLKEVGYTGPLAMVHDGPDDDEWGKLDEAWSLVTEVFGRP